MPAVAASRDEFGMQGRPRLHEQGEDAPSYIPERTRGEPVAYPLVYMRRGFNT